MGHDKYISGSFDPGSIKHTTGAEKYRCAGLWEETFLPSLGDNCFLARGFCSTAPSLRDARGEVGAVVWSYISRSVRKPFEGLIFTWTRLFPLNTSLLSTVMDVAHCGEEGEIVKECKELLFVFCSFSTNRSPFL